MGNKTEGRYMISFHRSTLGRYLYLTLQNCFCKLFIHSKSIKSPANLNNEISKKNIFQRKINIPLIILQSIT